MDRSSIANEPPLVEVLGLAKHVAVAGGEVLRIVDEVSFSIKRGESVAIVGASGSGKSTLLGLLAGLDIPSHGSVSIDRTELFNLNEDARAALRGRMIGFVFQSFQLLPALTALENVMLPLELAGAADARVQAEEWLTRVGLAARQRHYPKQLSGGEQQRVALARAFAPKPRLLLADEPTGNLDAATGTAIIDLLFELNHSADTTLILVTHDEALAARCDRILRMQAGRLSEEVPNAPDEALATDRR